MWEVVQLEKRACGSVEVFKRFLKFKTVKLLLNTESKYVGKPKKDLK